MSACALGVGGATADENERELVWYFAEAWPDGTVTIREEVGARAHSASCTGIVAVAPVTISCGPVAHGAATTFQSQGIGMGFEYSGTVTSVLSYSSGGSWIFSCTKSLGGSSSCTNSGTTKWGVTMTHSCSATGIGSWSCSASEA